MDDRSVDVKLTLDEGDWAVVGPITLYEFETQEEGEGSQSAENLLLMPRVFALAQNYPNPANGSTTIKYQLPREAHVNLRIYDVSGRLVRTLLDDRHKPGHYSISWRGDGSNGRKVSSGIYFYRLVADDFAATRKMVVLK